MGNEDMVKETHQLITQKLEANGEMGKLRALVTEASIRAFNEKDKDGKVTNPLFSPLPELVALKKKADGPILMGLLVEFLDAMGLPYTRSVLEMEALLQQSGSVASPMALRGRFPQYAADNGPLLLKLVPQALEGVPAQVPQTVQKAVTSASAPAVSEAKQPPTQVAAKAAPTQVAAKAAEKPAAAPSSPPPQSVPLTKAAPKGEETPYFIAKWSGREFTRINQVKGQQVAMDELTHCSIFVFDAVDSIMMDRCVDCELVVAACEGSVFLRDCENCRLAVACKQLRTRDCHDVDVRLFASTDPVIEASHHIHFYPFNIKAPNLRERFKEARLDPKVNRFTHIFDFTADDPKLPQPHYVMHFPDHGLKMVAVGDAHGPVDCPDEIAQLLEGKLEPAASSESGKNKSLDIKTGSKQWTGEPAAAKAEGAGAKPQAKVSSPTENSSKPKTIFLTAENSKSQAQPVAAAAPKVEKALPPSTSGPAAASTREEPKPTKSDAPAASSKAHLDPISTTSTGKLKSPTEVTKPPTATQPASSQPPAGQPAQPATKSQPASSQSVSSQPAQPTPATKSQPASGQATQPTSTGKQSKEKPAATDDNVLKRDSDSSYSSFEEEDDDKF